jgi:hypothetical protein
MVALLQNLICCDHILCFENFELKYRAEKLSIRIITVRIIAEA